MLISNGLIGREWEHASLENGRFWLVPDFVGESGSIPALGMVDVG